jgi:hypothetical protein
MALTSWKEFPFFSVSKVPVPADEDGTYVFDVSARPRRDDRQQLMWNIERWQLPDFRIGFSLSRHF